MLNQDLKKSWSNINQKKLLDENILDFEKFLIFVDSEADDEEISDLFRKSVRYACFSRFKAFESDLRIRQIDKLNFKLREMYKKSLSSMKKNKYF